MSTSGIEKYQGAKLLENYRKFQNRHSASIKSETIEKGDNVVCVAEKYLRIVDKSKCLGLEINKVFV